MKSLYRADGSLLLSIRHTCAMAGERTTCLHVGVETHMPQSTVRPLNRPGPTGSTLVTSDVLEMGSNADAECKGRQLMANLMMEV
jgi:hypothetical protein